MSGQSTGRCARVICLLTLLTFSSFDFATAQVLFSDSFNTNSSGAWTINNAPAANAHQQEATFAWDYSTFGIPAAPGSGDTLGLRLKANIPGSAAAPVTTRPVQVLSGLSLSPTGKDFGANYQLSFHVWANYFGSPNAAGLGDNVGSQGGTHNVLAAVGTSGTVPLVAGQGLAGATAPVASGANMDGIAFANSNDGGLFDDVRVFIKANVPAATSTGVYAAGTAAGGVNTAANPLNNKHEFYTSKFPSQTAPAVQSGIAAAEYGLDASDVMAGQTEAGTFGFVWHKVDIIKSGGTVTWKINDNVFSTVDVSALTLGGNNIAIGQSDVNTSTARHPAMVFTVYDNLVVTALPSPGLLGDFNHDDVVDGNDFLVWQRGESPTSYSVEDLNDWKANFGAVASGGVVAAASEPSAIGLAVVSLGIMGLCTRRRNAV